MLDREALGAEILAWYTAQKPDLDLADLVDRIAELVRSEPGVTLTPEEAALAEAAVRFMDPSVGGAGRERLRALAARLEASS